MKTRKLLLIALLIFALMLGACNSELNDTEAGGREGSMEPASFADGGDSAARNSSPMAVADSPERTESGSADVAVSSDSKSSSPSDSSPASTALPAEAPFGLTEREAVARADSEEAAAYSGGFDSDDAGIMSAPPPEPMADMLWSSVESDAFAVDSVIAPRNTQAGLLTAGEWNDNDNRNFWTNLMGQNSEFRGYADRWQLNTRTRFIVKVVDENDKPVRGAEVQINGFKAVTNHEGIAYVFRALSPSLEFNSPVTSFTITANGETQTAELDPASETVFVFNGAKSPAQLTLDLMFVIDTTGSMGDELRYLQTELDYVINSVSRNNANLPIRLSVNFYRDIGDEYVVRPFTFSTDIAAQVKNLNAQSADGGGDRPEAVDAALQNAIHEHEWDADSVKLMFIVLDAPPHHNQTTIPAMSRLAAEAAEKGIRIIPLLASDGCTETEFLMRTLAMVTGGTYTFVTGHSGISTGRHVEPTIGDYEVEKLNELLIKIINRYLQ
ncbi:MAG: VWA domain-containing protein [Oscillospiraceae bacterium]|nr:VWA domain-containing protein [Oscillospiraceae bacterium]